MKEIMRSYHVFLPRAWVKWCIYLLYPVLSVGGLYTLDDKMCFFPFICVAIAGGIIIAVEYMLDGYVFAGIATKETNRLEYLKTSVKGIPLLKKALMVDGIRRFCSTAVIILALYPMMKNNTELAEGRPLLCIVAFMLFTYLLLEIGLMILRFFMNISVTLVCIYLEWAIIFIIGVYIFFLPVRVWMVLILAAGCIVVAVAQRKWIIKKARDSYYD